MKITSHYEFPHEIDISPYVSEELRGEDCVYNIFSIVIHGGDAYGGHYHAFISPIGQNGQTKWFDFNDSKVEEINPNLIESQFKGSESACNIYFLISLIIYSCYSKKKKKKKNICLFIEEKINLHHNNHQSLHTFHHSLNHV